MCGTDVYCLFCYYPKARSIDFLGMDTPGKRDGSSPELLGNGSSDMVTKQTSGVKMLQRTPLFTVICITCINNYNNIILFKVLVCEIYAASPPLSFEYIHV